MKTRDLAFGRLAVSDFAMLRQSRWREAIASSFDRPELRTFLSGIELITVRYAQGAEAEMLAETIESVGRDPVALAALLMSADLAGPA